MTQRHASISLGNPPVTLELKTLLQAYLFESRQADSADHWLVMYFLKYILDNF